MKLIRAMPIALFAKMEWRVIRLRPRPITLASFSLAAALALGGCESDDAAYDRGYDDGYAVGYNTACEIRATMIAGDWDNSHYSEGYAEGQTDGTIACNKDRRSGAN